MKFNKSDKYGTKEKEAYINKYLFVLFKLDLMDTDIMVGVYLLESGDLDIQWFDCSEYYRGVQIGRSFLTRDNNL